jgi:iron complex outermembrane receptor protein
VIAAGSVIDALRAAGGRAGARGRRARRRRSTAACLLALAGVVAGSGPASADMQMAQSLEDLRNLSIEDLANIEITSVSRRPEPLSQAAASVYVITGEDIRRSGATNLPEALRLAPNLEVARRDSHQYAISARGFNSIEAANKLLVLIDGRTVYSPLHSGVFWDAHQVMLADVDRIEVISGPGGTLYGANAVNGVINIITKSSRDTQGGLADLRAGPQDQLGALRYGGKIGETGSYRAYAMGFGQGSSKFPDGSSVGDEWHGKQAGFRTDWRAGSAGFTVQGDLYDNRVAAGGELFDNVLGGGELFGGNLLGRWTQQFTGGSALEVQSFISRDRRSADESSEVDDTFDLQAQYNFKLGERNEVVVGGGHRINHDKFTNVANVFVLEPPSRTFNLSNAFLQDTYALLDNLKLTLGSKFEYNTFSGFEYLPSARLAWQVADNHLLWSAVSRSVRTPSRLDRQLVAPGLFDGGPDFRSEKLIAYEVGYRGRPLPDATLSVSLYYNQYDDIRTTQLSPAGGLPLSFGNGLEGDAYGVEAWGEYKVLPWWRLSPGFNFMHKNFRLKPGATDISNRQSLGDDPAYQAFLRSYMDLPGNVTFDATLRVVDDLPSPEIAGYTELDVRIGWRVTEAIELSVTGTNLLHDHHPETAAASPPDREIPRSVFAGVRLSF